MKLPPSPTGKNKKSTWLRRLWEALRALTPKDGPDIVWERQADGIRPIFTRRIGPGGAGGSVNVLLAQITGDPIEGDWILCDVEGAGSVKIAKPPTLRRTPYHGLTVHDVTYTYSDGLNRLAEVGLYTEAQTIVPAYRELDILYVLANPAGGTGVADAPEWIDLNVDGRAWAQTFVEGV